MNKSHLRYVLLVSTAYLEWDYDKSIKPQSDGSKYMKLTDQISTNDVQILILCHSYITITVTSFHG
jgi:hypothetical protein